MDQDMGRDELRMTAAQELAAYETICEIMDRWQRGEISHNTALHDIAEQTGERD